MEMKLKGPLVFKEERKVEGAHHEDGGEATQLGTLSRIHGADHPIPRKSTSPSYDEQVPALSRSDRSSTESFPIPSSNPKDTPIISQEDQLESTKAEMGEVREENERLKNILAKISKDYQSLQMKFFDVVQQEQDKKPVGTMSIPRDVEESELVSLSLGTSSSGQKKEEKANTGKTREDDKMEKGLALGLDCRYHGSSSSPNIKPPSNLSTANSFEENKEEEAGEPWPPSKILKNTRNVEDEVSQQTHVKKARVSVRARCDSPTMIDGCQWRKYGQKISKGNPCPRAYYRCTVAPACPVRKQVQRCAEDMSILITTYEGNHNHALPISATAMASTTSAAACMLMSGSTTSNLAIGSQVAPSSSSTTISAASANLHGLNFGLFDNSRAQQFYIPNPTISSTHSHPTITLDLTAPQPSSAAQTSQFNRFSSLSSTFTSNSRYSSTSFNFSSSESNTSPSSWSNGYLSYGSQPYNKSNLGSMNIGRQPQDTFYQSYLQNTTNPAPISSTQHSLTDTIAKAITSDPSFQSALTAAITSYVGGHGTQVGGDANHNLKWGEHFKSIASSTEATTGNGCASSFLTRTSSSNSNPRQGNLVFFQEPMALSSSKSSSASPVDTRENIN